MKVYKPHKTMPTTGEFLAIWTFNDKVWSDKFKWDDGELMYYNAEEDFYSKESNGFPSQELENIIYVTFEEE